MVSALENQLVIYVWEMGGWDGLRMGMGEWDGLRIEDRRGEWKAILGGNRQINSVAASSAKSSSASRRRPPHPSSSSSFSVMWKQKGKQKLGAEAPEAAIFY